MLKSGRDSASRNSRPSSASRATTGSAQPSGPTRSRSGITSSTSNIPGSAENIKALIDRGRSERPHSGNIGTKSSKGPSIKPKQTTTSIQRQKAAKRSSPARSGTLPASMPKNMKSRDLTNREQLEKMEKMEKKLQEFELQNNAVQDLQYQLKQLQQQINTDSSKSSLSVENDQLRKQLTTLSQTMANINYKEGSSTPDSLSDYESNKTNDKRLSIAEELDATQNELTEAQEKLTQAIQQNIEMKNEREEIIQRLKEYAQLPGSGSLMDLLKCAIEDRSKQCRTLQSQLNDIEEENEGIRKELAETKNSSKHMEEIEELQSKIVELESELETRNSEYCEVLEMDQADREEFAIQTKANLDLAKEKDEIITRLELEAQEQKDEHRRDLIELSNHIDEMRERDEKKDSELEQLRVTLYDLEDAILQQIAMKKYAEQQLQKQTEETNKVYEELMQKDQELIRLRRINQQNEDEREQLQRNVSLAMTVAKDAKESKQNEIDELRQKKHGLEEENMRLQFEINNLQRNRRNSPTLKDEPLSPTNSSSPSSGYKPAPTTVSDDWRFSRRRSKTSGNEGNQTNTVQNLIESFNPKDEKNDSNSSSASASGSTSKSTSERLQNSERRKISVDQQIKRAENDKQARERVARRVMELTKKASERPAEKDRPSALTRRTSSVSSVDNTIQASVGLPTIESSFPSVISSDPLTKLSKKYGGSKRNSLLKWCHEQLKDYKEIEVTNFSTTWADGLALCALLHSRLPLNVPYRSLVVESNKRKNVETALKACQVLGIAPNNLPSVDDFLEPDRPDWQRIMKLVTQIYIHFTQQENTLENIL